MKSKPHTEAIKALRAEIKAIHKHCDALDKIQDGVNAGRIAAVSLVSRAMGTRGLLDAIDVLKRDQRRNKCAKKS